MVSRFRTGAPTFRGLPRNARRVAPKLALVERMAIQQADHFQPGPDTPVSDEGQRLETATNRWLDGWDFDGKIGIMCTYTFIHYNTVNKIKSMAKLE